MVQRLMAGQEFQHPSRQRRVQPEHLQGRDDGVATEGGREPGDPRIGIRPRGQLGRQQGEVGAGFVDPGVEQARPRMDPSPPPPLAAHAEMAPRRRRPPAGAIGFLPLWADLHIEAARAIVWESQLEGGAGGGEGRRLLGETDMSLAHHAIQAAIGELHVGGVHLCGEDFAARRSAESAHLEHVAKIRAEIEGEGHLGGGHGEIGEGDPLIHAVGVDEPLALDVDHPFLQGLGAQRRQGAVGQVGGEDHIVLTEGGAEQHRSGRARPPLPTHRH